MTESWYTRERALYRDATVHLPRLGVGPAGGDWATIAAILREELVAQGIAVTVYDSPQ